MNDDGSKIKYWSEITSVNKSIRESPERKSIEYRKGSIEISKILITNIHLINAGGIVGIPAVYAIYDFSSFDLQKRVLVLAIPFAAYTCGLIAATFCALMTYFNYMRWAEYYDIEEEGSLLRFEHVLPYANTSERISYRSIRLEEIKKEKMQKTESINFTFWVAHVFEWLSAASFICGTSYLIYRAAWR